MACDLRRAFCVARLAPCGPWPLHRLLILSSDYVLEGQNAFPPDGPQVSVISGAGGQHGAWRTRAAQEREGPGQVGLAGPASPARAAARRQRRPSGPLLLAPRGAGEGGAGRGGAGDSEGGACSAARERARELPRWQRPALRGPQRPALPAPRLGRLGEDGSDLDPGAGEGLAGRLGEDATRALARA